MCVSRLTVAAAVTALVAGTPALADVTPQQVWDELQGYLESFGYEVTARETTDGDRLVVTPLSIAMPMPEDNGSGVFEIGEMILEPTGDGSVSVRLPETMPIMVKVDPKDEESIDMALDYHARDFALTVSGDPGDLSYDFAATSLGIELVRLIVDGETIPPEGARFDASTGPVDGDARVVHRDGGRDITQTVSLGDLTYDLMFDDPESRSAGTLSGTLTGLHSATEANVPDAPATGDAALRLSNTSEFGAGSSRFSFSEDGKTATGETSSEGGRIAVKLSGDDLAYDVAADGVNWAMTSGDLPFPVSASMDEMRFNLAMPTAVSETPEDAALGVTLGGLTLSDGVWSIFDPEGVMPRDPATVMLDLTAKVTPLVDFTNPEAMAGFEMLGKEPAELNALTLRNLTVEAVGARLTGEGAFTFDNSDKTTFDGVPRPEGQLDLSLTGANALMDRLIELGAIEEREAMGARMMLGMFAVPGDEPDSLTSTLEVNDKGQVLANGQRIR